MAQCVFSDVDALTDWLRARIVPGTPHLIGIDGVNFTGKSTLARSLGSALGCTVIECDDFIQDGNKPYPEILDLASLQSEVELATALGVVVIDSLCLQLVLDALGMATSSQIYVRHSWPPNTYTHEALLDAEVGEEELLSEEDEICRAAGIADDDPILARELIAYHKRRRPHDNADAIYESCFEPAAAA